MAKKKTETISLIDTFSEFKETKNIDRTTMVGVLEESFRSVLELIFLMNDALNTQKSAEKK